LFVFSFSLFFVPLLDYGGHLVSFLARKYTVSYRIYLDVICCLAFMGTQYALCIAGQPVPFPSPQALSQRMHQPLPPLLISHLIALVVLGTKIDGCIV